MDEPDRGRINYFNADYRDGTVFIDRKRYPAGSFCVALLNDYPHIYSEQGNPVHSEAIREVSYGLQEGRLVDADFMKAGEEILHILDLAKRLKPFDILLSGRLNDAPSVTLNDAISTYPQACVAV